MLMKFSCAVFLALASVGETNAFLPLSVKKSKAVPVPLQLMGRGWDNDGFLEGLSGDDSKKPEKDDDDGKEEVSSGGSRFKEVMEAANSYQAAERPPQTVENPFLNPPPPPQLAARDQLSIEDQARMFREMTQQQSRSIPQGSQRTAKTDRAGRPVGRNRDADQIANTADVYFAQLKRDSTVRMLARQRGEEDIAQAVFADDGIKILDNLLQENPYLKGQKEEDAAFMKNIPSEALRPFMESSQPRAEELASSGVSYKELLKQRKNRSGAGASTSAAPTQSGVAPPEPPAAQAQPKPEAPEPIQSVVVPTNPIQQEQEKAPEPRAVAAPPQPAVSSTLATSSTPEETRQKIRTLMGFLLKHRGGPGFGSGILRGAEIDRFDNLLQEVTSLLKEEAGHAAPQNPPMMTAPAAAAVSDSVTAARTVTPNSPSDMAQVESTIACIEGAITMYKNCPPELKESILVTLRAALMSAVNTCNKVIADNDVVDYAASQAATGGQPNSPSDMAQVESTIACIEGAVTMFKNCPPEMKEGILVALRAALMSAVNTCNKVIANNEGVNYAAYQAPASAEPLAAAVPVGTDPNSEILEKIYNDIQAAAGNGSLGIRSDLTSDEASDLADQLVDMRHILMNELDAGIPDPEPAAAAPEGAADGGTVSKYQQMLAKAKAEKAAKAS